MYKDMSSGNELIFYMYSKNGFHVIIYSFLKIETVEHCTCRTLQEFAFFFNPRIIYVYILVVLAVLQLPMHNKQSLKS